MEKFKRLSEIEPETWINLFKEESMWQRLFLESKKEIKQ